MALKLSTGRRSAPIWAHVYGPEGVGKSSFAADAPDPVFLDLEQGTNNLATSRLTFDAAGDRTRPLSFGEVLSGLASLRTESHDRKTVVIDTVDALEALIWAHVCHQSQVKTIEDFGYGKGYVIALNPWRQIIDEIEALRLKGYNVITLGHAVLKPFKNPEGDDFDRYIPKLHEKAGALIKERADAVLFARFRESVRKDAQTKRVRGVSDGARVIHTRRTAAFDAKNRYDLPEEMPLSWSSFFAAVQAHKPADPTATKAAIVERIAKLAEADATEARGYLEKAGADAVKLSKLLSWVNAKLPDDAPAVAPAAQPAAAAEPAPAAQPEPAPGSKPAPSVPAAYANTAMDKMIAQEAVAGPAKSDPPKPEPKGEDRSLQPGVDVPAMEKKPDPAPAPAAAAPAVPARPAEKSPHDKAVDEILEASEKCRTPADLARLVLPLMKKAIDAKLFTPAEIESNRTWYTDLAAALKKSAAAANGAAQP